MRGYNTLNFSTILVTRGRGNIEANSEPQRCCGNNCRQQRRWVELAMVTHRALTNNQTPIASQLGIPVKSTLDNTTTVQYAGLMSQLADKARSVVRDLDPSNDMTFLRVRSKKHEIMVAPDKDFILIVIQNPTD